MLRMSGGIPPLSHVTALSEEGQLYVYLTSFMGQDRYAVKTVIFSVKLVLNFTELSTQLTCRTHNSERGLKLKASVAATAVLTHSFNHIQLNPFFLFLIETDVINLISQLDVTN
jgi:hypothetical protein